MTEEGGEEDEIASLVARRDGSVLGPFTILKVGLG
jgi:hypothetical protein